MIYRNAQPLDVARHGLLRLRTPLSFQFAKALQAVPVGLSEIPLAAQWYPIAFTSEDPCRPIAVLGLGRHENLFVDDDGRWKDGAYVPALIRRFPFGLAELEGRDVLCVETTSEVLSEGVLGAPLFEGDALSQTAQSALRLCQAIAADERQTETFVGKLQALDLLDHRTATVELNSGERVSLSGFLTIDESRFRRLSDEVFLDLRRRGWLAPIYAQIQSTLNWGRLADHVQARRAA